MMYPVQGFSGDHSLRILYEINLLNNYELRFTGIPPTELWI